MARLDVGPVEGNAKDRHPRLHRPTGQPAVATDQLQHLLRCADIDNLTPQLKDVDPLGQTGADIDESLDHGPIPTI